MSIRRIALFSFVSLALLSACSSTKLDNTAEVTGKVMPPSAETGAVSTVTGVVADHLNPNSLISTQRSVYFDFDQFVVRASDASVLARQGQYLASKPNVVVRLEGHADERGGREYNLALGQKRAEAVARALKVYGVSDKQAEPVSFGSEKPRAEGHDEAAWSQNRRVDIAYPNK